MIKKTNGSFSVCEEALMLLRQDVVLPVREDGDTLDAERSVIARKVALAYDSAVSIVTSSYGWGSVIAGEVNNWASYVRAVLVACLARELAIPVTGRGSDVEVCQKFFEDKLQIAKRKCFLDEVEEARRMTTDKAKLYLECYTTLAGNFASDDIIPYSWGDFTKRIDDVFKSSVTEVLSSYHWNFARRTVAIEEFDWNNMIAVLDCVNEDGDSVEWCINGSAVNIADDAQSIIYTAFVDDLSKWDYSARSALVVKILTKVCAWNGKAEGKINLRSAFETLYDKVLREAIVNDLNNSNQGNDLVREVISTMRGHCDISDVQLARSALELPRRIRDVYEGCRVEVLLSRDWNFARRIIDNPTGELSTNVLKVRNVYGIDREVISGWTVGDRKIIADEPMARVEYTDDVRSLKRWTPLVRRALVYCIIRELVASAPQGALDVSVASQLYDQRLRLAAIHDARETKPGREHFGRNVYADRIRGRAGYGR